MSKLTLAFDMAPLESIGMIVALTDYTPSVDNPFDIRLSIKRTDRTRHGPLQRDLQIAGPARAYTYKSAHYSSQPYR